MGRDKEEKGQTSALKESAREGIFFPHLLKSVPGHSLENLYICHIAIESHLIKELRNYMSLCRKS